MANPPVRPLLPSQNYDYDYKGLSPDTATETPQPIESKSIQEGTEKLALKLILGYFPFPLLENWQL